MSRRISRGKRAHLLALWTPRALAQGQREAYAVKSKGRIAFILKLSDDVSRAAKKARKTLSKMGRDMSAGFVLPASVEVRMLSPGRPKAIGAEEPVSLADCISAIVPAKR